MSEEPLLPRPSPARNCSLCHQPSISYFCYCDVDKAFFCNRCVLTHKDAVDGPWHLITPVNRYGDSEYKKRVWFVQHGKEDFLGKIRNLEKSKEKFIEATRNFHSKINLFQEKVVTSFDNLQKELHYYVISGVEEAKMSPISIITRITRIP